MDKETASYIINYFSSLLTADEQKALRHYHSTIKLEDDASNSARVRIYKKVGWLTEDPSISDLLKDGYDQFELNTAQRILSGHPDKVFLNHCPVCHRLARTPQARQCRYCGHDWHGKT